VNSSRLFFLKNYDAYIIVVYMGWVSALKTVAKGAGRLAAKGAVKGGSYMASAATSYVSMKLIKYGAISLLLLAL